MNLNAKETNMKELTMDEMEMVNGGSIIGLCCVLGLVAVECGIAAGIGLVLKYCD